ncbi:MULTISPECIES: SpoIIIAH-like family protein [Allobacillus]|uniref:SpoIIIAH-like family protein n=1 Tax=Allobacillus salarius TaxID=1955272 RepID=A0A556PTF2_9BACI|nr:SpoIIIAH-like family protein [Allobacillus salarius]TSJ67664.1 SpoIIIAH-like family protein [Allobacillus salarius]
MVLKKQTVWLITMLSLLIVLSVYYMLPGDDQAAMTDLEDEQTEEERSDEEEGDGAESENFVVSELPTGDYFQTIRLETEDSRSEMKEKLSEVISSTTATSEEKNDAMDQIYSIETMSQKESLLEKMIIQEKNYEDVLVRKADDKVNVTVMANELSKTDANHIMQMARDEFGMLDVTVKYQGEVSQQEESDDDEQSDDAQNQEQEDDDEQSDDAQQQEQEEEDEQDQEQNQEDQA